MATIHLPHDFKGFLKFLYTHEVEYLLIGGYAISSYGYPRTTAGYDSGLNKEEWNIVNPQKMDSWEWVRRFMVANFKPLDRDVIDGVIVEGVEIHELGVIKKWSGQTPIEDYAARL